MNPSRIFIDDNTIFLKIAVDVSATAAAFFGRTVHQVSLRRTVGLMIYLYITVSTYESVLRVKLQV